MNSFDEMRINIGLENQWKYWNLDGKSIPQFYFCGSEGIYRNGPKTRVKGAKT